MLYHFKRVWILLLFDFAFSVVVNKTLAQSIPNGDFEEWLTGLYDPPFWVTNNIYPPPLECRQVFQSDQAYSGNFCIEGVVDTCPELSILRPPLIQSYEIPISSSPEALHGFYKFLPVDDDRFSTAIMIYKNDTVIGEGILVSEQEVTIFTAFIINIDYTTNDSPDVAVIEFTIDSSVTSNKLHQGSKWYIDYLFFGPLSDVHDEETSVPNTFSMYQNYPNPFNLSTKIKYSIPPIIVNEVKQSQIVSLNVYDVLGNEIETLVNEEKPAGTYEITWYAENLPSGVYFYQLKAGSYVEMQKMLLLK